MNYSLATRTVGIVGITLLPMTSALGAQNISSANTPGRHEQAVQPEQSESLLEFNVDGEIRWKFNSFRNGFLSNGANYEEALNRNIVGFQLKYGNKVEAYVELANGEVISSNVSESFANYDNKIALQQAYVRTNFDILDGTFSTQLGRIEFADAPKQLMSPGDGPNIRKSWNGGVVEYKNSDFSVEGFNLDFSKPGPEWFDEVRDASRSMNGVLVKYRIQSASDTVLNINPLYLESTDLALKVNGVAGADRRKTFGVGIASSVKAFSIDVLAVKQTGTFDNRNVDAWAVFGQSSYTLTAIGWEPKISLRVDLASGGNSKGTSELNTFNQLNASSGYLGQGLFFSTANLTLVTPSLTLKPTANTQISVDYGFARKMRESEFAYAGQMRPYIGSEGVKGKDLGQLARVYAEWKYQKSWKLFFGYEHLNPGSVLENIDFGLSSMLFFGVTYRY